jgi:hypothetical protein
VPPSGTRNAVGGPRAPSSSAPTVQPHITFLLCQILATWRRETLRRAWAPSDRPAPGAGRPRDAPCAAEAKLSDRLPRSRPSGLPSIPRRVGADGHQVHCAARGGRRRRPSQGRGSPIARSCPGTPSSHRSGRCTGSWRSTPAATPSSAPESSACWGMAVVRDPSGPRTQPHRLVPRRLNPPTLIGEHGARGWMRLQRRVRPHRWEASP